MESEHDDSMIQTLCGAYDDDEEQGQRLDAKNIAICHLTLKALCFKHGIKLGASGENPETVNTGADGIMPYMKCILTNIFMKRILGRKCVEAAGGKQAFRAAQALMTAQSATPRNTTCEGKDLQSGDSSQNPDTWTLMEIMGRWFDRNTTGLKDGNVGALGEGCMVAREKTNGRKDDQLGELKEKVRKQMEEVGQDMAMKIATILPQVKTCTTTECVKSIIEQEKQKDSVSTAPKGKGDGQSGPPPGKPAPAKPAPPPVTGAGEQPHKPAPAKPAPVKPVAATPGPAVTPGATASSGGGGKAGKGAAGGGKENGKTVKAAKGDNCEWMSIQQDKTRHTQELQQLHTVLGAFAQHMQTHEQLVDAYGANCDNSGWNDFDDAKTHHTGQTVADMIRCRLMSSALWFANKEDPDKQGQDEMANRFRCEVANVFGYMLKNQYCKKEGWKRGVEYAWKALQEMGKDVDGKKGLTGPVMAGRCTQCGYVGSMTKLGIINGDIAQWLVDQGIMREIAQIQQQMPCHKDWKKYKKEKGGTDNKVIENDKIPEVTAIEKKVVEETEKVIEKVKDKIDQEIANGKAQSTHGTKPVAGGGGDQKGEKPSAPSAAGTSGTGTSSGQPRSDSSAGEGQPAAGGTAGEGPGQGPGPGQQPPPPPPNNEPSGKGPTEETTQQSSTDTQGEDECQDDNSDTKASGIETHANSLVTVARGTHTYEGQQPSCATLKALEDNQHAATSPNPSSGTGEGKKTDATDADGKELPTVDTAGSEPHGAPAQDNTSVQDGTSKPANGGASTSYANVQAGNIYGDIFIGASIIPESERQGSSVPHHGRAPGNSVVDAGNDDPPPLNPPKPKPNPNPDQTGSSGTPTETRTPADGVSGGEGKGGGGGGSPSSGPGSTGHQNPGSSGTGTGSTGGEGTGDFCKVDAKNSKGDGTCAKESSSSNSSSTSPPDPFSDCSTKDCKFGLDPDVGLNIKDAAGGFMPPIPADGTLSSSGDNQGGKDDGYAVPDLTADVLTATTPVLFFLSAVIVALLGYSLWKNGGNKGGASAIHYELLGYTEGKASTLGTSSANVTSQFDTVDATRVGSTTVTLSDGTDVGKRGQRNFYDGQSTGAPKNRLFDSMCKNLKPGAPLKKPQHKNKTAPDITARNSCRRGLKKLTRCKMGRRAWLGLVVVSTVLYSSFISIMPHVMSIIMQEGQILNLSFWMGLYGGPILITVIYSCVLLCFCCSKTGKCLLDKIWKKKKKKEAPTETDNNIGVNKESNKT
ncbi:hypothetical protein AK88_03344 [Plasmodium fragile]|uniref:Schizont-infected cell agglutination extracellular alpha domain-containing protein n=1 Tax=Plasmodium fragile TaxID=5857 RepID=A0A0D9QJB3_PLAFR|nr:uncharacterized protein AK88_03344 [Plasmodium fragile]KJP87058.1 hypothetical protein AK88_03344 [Plasmodium fragile]